ncbi:MAG: hypothetical protein RLZZ324_824 [Candidatus Parcubacteria bacterium]|jgi:O-antigen ligase
MNALYYAIVAFCALLPLYLVRFALPVPGLRLPTTALECVFAALFLTWLVMRGRSADAWRALRAWALPITVFVTGATVSMLVSPSLTQSLGLWRAYVLEPIFFFTMFVDVVARKKRGAAVLAALGTTLAVVGIIAVYQKVTGAGIPNPIWAALETRRVTAFYGFPNAIGLMAAPVTVLMLGWTISLLERRGGSSGWTRPYAWLTGAAAMLGMLATFFAVSEGGMIGTLAGATILGLTNAKLRAWTLGAIIIGCGAVMSVPRILNYATGIVSLSDDSGSVRRIIWGETMKMLSNNAVFGAGLSGYPGRIAPYHLATWIEVFQYPHDIVMNFWSETGVIGLIGFAWICVTFFVIGARLLRAGKRDSWLAAALMAAMTATLVHGLVDVPYFKNDLAMLFWIMAGLMEALREGHAGTEEVAAPAHHGKK